MSLEESATIEHRLVGFLPNVSIARMITTDHKT
jgi:hypothetical protein